MPEIGVNTQSIGYFHSINRYAGRQYIRSVELSVLYLNVISGLGFSRRLHRMNQFPIQADLNFALIPPVYI